MTSSNNKPFFLYSYDPPTPEKVSEYDPPSPEQMVLPNSRNFQVFSRDSVNDEDQFQRNADSNIYQPRVDDAKVGKQFYQKVFPDEIGYITDTFYAKVLNTRTKPKQTSAALRKSWQEDVSENSTVPSAENFKSVPETEIPLPKNGMHEGNYLKSSVSEEDQREQSAVVSETELFITSAETFVGSKLYFPSKLVQTGGTVDEKSCDNELSTPSLATTSDVARCSSPTSTTFSVSSLPSDTITMNLPYDSSLSELPGFEYDKQNAPDAANRISLYSTSSENALDVSSDSAFTQSISPMLTESCTITPIVADIITPNSTNPTSPLPSPIPSEVFIVSTNESANSPSTPSSIIKADMQDLPEILERLLEVRDDQLPHPCKNETIDCRSDVDNKVNGATHGFDTQSCASALYNTEVDANAIASKNLTVAQLSSLFEAMSCKSKLKTGTRSTATDGIFLNTDQSLKSIEGQKYHDKTLNNNEPESTQNYIISVEDHIVSIARNQDEAIAGIKKKENICINNNETINREAEFNSEIQPKKFIDSEISKESPRYKNKEPPIPPLRSASSKVLPPPIPPPPNEDLVDHLPSLPMPSYGRIPKPPARKYLLIPLESDRRIVNILGPPLPPPRSSSLLRMSGSPATRKSNTAKYENVNNDFCSLQTDLEIIVNDVYFQKINGRYMRSLTPVPEERSSPTPTSTASLIVATTAGESDKNCNSERINEFINFSDPEQAESKSINTSHLRTEHNLIVGHNTSISPPNPGIVDFSNSSIPPPSPKRIKSMLGTPASKNVLTTPETSVHLQPKDLPSDHLGVSSTEPKMSQVPTTLDPPPSPAFSEQMISVSPYRAGVIDRTDLPLLSPEEEVRNAFTSAKAWGWMLPDRETLAIYTQIRPVIQQGPQCGLVALSMATQVLPVTVSVEYLCKKAQEKGYSTHGEMFSAESMKNLVNGFADGVEASVRTDILSNPPVLIRTLLEGDLILVPYDADHNHQPGFYRGLKSHWGLICGCLLQSLSPIRYQEMTSAKLDVHLNHLWHLRPKVQVDGVSRRPSSEPSLFSHSFCLVNERCARSLSPPTFGKSRPLRDWCWDVANVIVIWRQGKSRKIVFSPISVLQKSNEQLVEYSHTTDFIIDNVETDLSGRVVVLHKVKPSLSDLLAKLHQEV